MWRDWKLDSDRYRLAEALWVWRAWHRLRGEGSEPDCDAIAARLAAEAGVEEEFAVIEERLGVVVKGMRR